MITHKDQRVGIFIDVQNLYHSSKNLFRARVNYKELIRGLVAGRKLIRAIGYVVKTDDNTESGEAAFFEALGKSGVELRIKDIQIFPGGAKKADWDVGMAVDAIRMADFLDTVILVTGDGDFVPLVEYLKWGKGRNVEVAAFNRSTSAKLKEAADAFINIEEIPKVILSSKRAFGHNKPTQNFINNEVRQEKTDEVKQEGI
ncbi:MAG: NYN domain-containing protein [Patescibacteria group bacterium]